MFTFVVKYLGFLKSVPLLAHVFDSQLKLWVLVSNPRLSGYLDNIEVEVSGWKGISVGVHKYGGIQFNYNGKEIGHIHSNGLLDVLFNRKIKCQLMNEGLINNHHIFSNSGWISFYIKTKEDGVYAKELLRMAYLKNNNAADIL
jgi:hypothetical protein